MSTYLGQHRAPRAVRRTRLWRSALAGVVGLSVVGAASASSCAEQAVALPHLAPASQAAIGAAAPSISESVRASDLSMAGAGMRSTPNEGAGSLPSPDSGEAVAGHAPAAAAAGSRAIAAQQAADRASTAASRSSRARAAATAAQAAQVQAAQVKAAQAKAARLKAAQLKAARLKAMQSPAAVLSRTPAARSTRTSRVAALAFPALRQFTWVGPVSGTRQTSSFGPRWGRLHAGLDFAGPVGTPLRSLSSGVVVHAGPQGGYGNKVSLLMWDGSLVNYGHMDSIAVKRGQKVAPGQMVGRLGNTGHSTGPHLHIEVRPDGVTPIDPWPWFVARGILPRDVPRS